ncbi:MAG TPA: Maf family protein [Coriobacteriia bacterium]|nr:Maf family protein [Coriobacteriia bacterium]
MTQHQLAHRILLASHSPRRRRLLTLLGLDFDMAAVETPEELDTPMAADPATLAAHLAAEKALAARTEGLAEEALVLAFDTIVVHEGSVMGKPADDEDAWRMLRSLSGRTHEVVTGVALLCPDEESPTAFAVTTRVQMDDLSDARIIEWMGSGEFRGCAGAYNIEGQVADVAATECFNNVAGLPLCHLYQHLTGPDAPGCLPQTPKSPCAACDMLLGRTCELGPQLA